MKAYAPYCTTTSVAAALIAALVSGNAHSQGQQGSGSPYSAYGFGDLAGTAQSVQAMMGGVGIAMADPFGVSSANPASYPYLSHTSFEAGIVVRNIAYDSETISSRGRNTRMQGLSLGVPFAKGHWGLALGVNPVSTVSYKITEVIPVEGGNASLVYSGNGGLNRAYLGAGCMLWQQNDSVNRGGKLSVGANLNYVFGAVQQSRKAYYPSGNGYYNAAVTHSLVVRSPMGSVGLQYAGDLIGLHRARHRMAARKERLRDRDARSEMEWLNAGRDPKDRRKVRIPRSDGDALRFRLGFSAELPAKLAARSSTLATNFLVGSTGVEFPRDTSTFIDGARGTLEMPVLLGAGFAVYNSHWTVALEHRRRDWSQLRVNAEGFEQGNSLNSGASYAVGASFRPSGKERGNFFTGAAYRMGVRYADDYITVNGTDLSQIGMSFGLSLPVMGSSTRSRINIGAELGERGTTSDGLLRERYADLYIGITITPDLREQWFKKRRLE
ncbi:MAG: hypothetical protein IPL52_13620 [Flavobacteriales bacterium]|nr:hypothetical protein [Flavobacteriales bacterium]